MLLRLLPAVLVLALGGCSAERPPLPHVDSVVDGDTVRIDFGSHVETVRLLGLDAPESVDPNRPVQCGGPEASERLRRLLPEGTPIRVTRDEVPRDRYGRLLAYVHATDGTFVNETMLAEGHAALSIIDPNRAHQATLEAAELRARTAALGLWGRCDGPDQPLDPPWPSP